MKEIRALCDTYGAWLHCDGCFGAFASLVPELQANCEGLASVDSLTVDGHKWANVSSVFVYVPS